MNPIEPAELSAYLDGELAPGRAREVEAALAQEPALRAELAALARDDARWRAAVRAAAFPAKVQLPGTRTPVHARRMLAGVLVLLCVRFLPKLAGSLAPLFAFNALALALILVWVVVLVRSTEQPSGAT